MRASATALHGIYSPYWWKTFYPKIWLAGSPHFGIKRLSPIRRVKLIGYKAVAEPSSSMCVPQQVIETDVVPSLMSDHDLP